MYQRLGKEKKDFHEIGWVRVSIRTRLKGLGSRSCASVGELKLGLGEEGCPQEVGLVGLSR